MVADVRIGMVLARRGIVVAGGGIVTAPGGGLHGGAMGHGANPLG